jgi:hypothetical protein
MARAVRSSGSSRSSMTSATLRRPAWVDTLAAAMTRPSPSRIGAATDRSPSSSSWSTRAQPCSRMVVSSARNANGSAMVCEVSGTRVTEAR